MGDHFQSNIYISFQINLTKKFRMDDGHENIIDLKEQNIFDVDTIKCQNNQYPQINHTFI